MTSVTTHGGCTNRYDKQQNSVNAAITENKCERSKSVSYCSIKKTYRKRWRFIEPKLVYGMKIDVAASARRKKGSTIMERKRNVRIRVGYTTGNNLEPVSNEKKSKHVE